MSKYPRLVAYPKKLTQNAQTILSWCREANVDVTFVGKCITEDPALLPHILETGMVCLADSRLENLAAARTTLPKLLLRIGMPDTAEEIVSVADISAQSEPATISALARTAERSGRRHKIILMIDLGDLREGILYSDREAILEAASAVVRSPALELYGIGTNLTCYGSIVPDKRNLGILCDIADMLRDHFRIPLPVVSGGNSSSLALLRSGDMPSGINNLRIGEALLLGTDTSTGKKFPELWDDAFVLEAELVEIKEKPTFPIGTRSVDAFGKEQEYQNLGIRRRGILAVGKQDLPIDALIPMEKGVFIYGGSSDHTIVDLGDISAKVGDILRFKLSYGGLLGAYTSKYVTKCVHTEKR